MTDSESTPQSSRPTQWPAVSIRELVTMCTSPALIGLGIVPVPGQEQPEIDLPMARHYIDLLELLDQKIADQLDDNEQRELDEALHELRMAFVQMQQAVEVQPAAPDRDHPQPHDGTADGDHDGHADPGTGTAAAPARAAADADEPGPDQSDASDPIEDPAEDD